MTRTLTFLIFPSGDVQDQWLGVCLDFDVWTFADSVETTARLLEDAVLTTLEDASVESLEPSAPEHWHRAYEIIKRAREGQAIKAPVASMDAIAARIEIGVLLPAYLLRTDDGGYSFLPGDKAPVQRRVSTSDPGEPQAA